MIKKKEILLKWNREKLSIVQSALAAMDEWGRQCWNEAKKKRSQLNEDGFCVNYTYDDYVKELEG